MSPTNFVSPFHAMDFLVRRYHRRERKETAACIGVAALRKSTYVQRQGKIFAGNNFLRRVDRHVDRRVIRLFIIS